ncbi:hypothetical protein GCM10010156_51200 [Planobispora rosea]|uniref:Uncharacterized protein n=1 Tax=Planobispora rosea TaxID=35762 RepID=A0A8J3S923_PLARO|nr:hypothetical protein GCM10010156_51200 [Planobispora rosea]GIH89054.1 hypothetical protein Pro02_74620 [Planobispora rosea]
MPESEALRRIEEITARRVRCDDPDLEALTDGPLEVAAYVAAHRRVPGEVLRRDVLDALVLLEYGRRAIPVLPGRLDRLEHRLLSLGVESGLSLGELAAALGLRSRQAVQHRLLRHAAAERGAPRSEVAERAARRGESRERAWLDRNAAALLACTAQLLEHRDRLTRTAQSPEHCDRLTRTTRPPEHRGPLAAAPVPASGPTVPEAAPASDPELAESFDELAESLSRVPADPRDPAHLTRTRHLAARLRLLLADLAAAPAVTALPGGHPLRALLARTTRLATAHQSASSA